MINELCYIHFIIYFLIYLIVHEKELMWKSTGMESNGISSEADRVVCMWEAIILLLHCSIAFQEGVKWILSP